MCRIKSIAQPPLKDCLGDKNISKDSKKAETVLSNNKVAYGHTMEDVEQQISDWLATQFNQKDL